MPNVPVKKKPVMMTGSAAGGVGRLEKTAAAPGKNTRMNLNKGKGK